MYKHNLLALFFWQKIQLAFCKPQGSTVKNLFYSTISFTSLSVAAPQYCL